MTAAAVEARRGRYDPQAIIQGHGELREVMALLESGHFNQFEPGLFEPIIQAIRNPHDPWMTAGDFPDYVRAQEAAATAYRDPERWLRMAILNTAHSGRFSSDRTIAEYNRDIWRLPTVAPLAL
jgi:starch phosphorylase